MPSALLDCLHLIHGCDPELRVEDEIPCPTEGCDNTEAEVVKIIADPWEWIVECKDCGYSRRCGQAAGLAHIMSTKHAATGHRLRMRKLVDPDRVALRRPV